MGLSGAILEAIEQKRRELLSVRASPPAAGPLSSRMGYIRAGLGCLGAALKQRGDAVQGWLTISKPGEL